MAVLLAVVSAGIVSMQGPPVQEAQPKEGATPEMIRVQVLDDQGRPVKGALVGTSAMTSDQGGEVRTGLWLFGKERVDAAETGDDGAANVSPDTVFYGEADTETKPLIAWTTDHAMVGMSELARPVPAGPVTVRLVPACRLEIRITSEGLEKLGRRLTWSNAYLQWGATRPMSSDTRTGRGLFFVPPGDYRLDVYGADTDSVYPPLKIEAGERSRTITIDLPASRIAELQGKPAPELAQVKGWVNGGPVRIADLKGKVVLLDFWGYWCGPCCYAMPELMDLHEKYKDRGLVIIAVHDDSVADIAEMKAKLERPKAEMWHGKDLPFLIALDGGGKTEVPGHGWTSRGATTAAYGITAFPTQVLIDRDGRVVGRATREMIELMLNAAPPG